MQYDKLPGNNKICVRAWQGAHVLPGGEFLPCCHTAGVVFDNRYKLDSDDLESININKNNIISARNSGVWKSLRRDMISGVENSICKTCWDMERQIGSSYRMQTNEKFSSSLVSLDYDETGAVSIDTPLIYWDVRNTNLCNMKCVMCSPGYSSMIQQEALDNFGFKRDYPVAPIKAANTDGAVLNVSDQGLVNIRQSVLDNIETIQEIYFAGGEPMISRLHYEILDLLAEHQRFDCMLSYNTNLLKLNYQNIDILNQYWSKFNYIGIGASIDCTGARAEWARNGTRWANIHANIEQIKHYISTVKPNIGLNINATVSMYTVAGLAELIEWFESTGIPGHITMSSILRMPEHFQVKVLPMEYRLALLESLRSYIFSLPNHEKYTQGGDRSGRAGWPSQWSIIERTLQEPEPDNVVELRKLARRHVGALDAVRKTSILEACPEFKEFWYEW